MFKLWGKGWLVPVLVLCCLLLSSVKARASEGFLGSKYSYFKLRASPQRSTLYRAIALLDSQVNLLKEPNIYRQDKVNSKIKDRQENLSNNFNSKPRDSDLFFSQVDRVDRLQDVKPTDWSYEALRGLIDRYGCIKGFENRTYRGEQNVSRAEFAAG